MLDKFVILFIGIDSLFINKFADVKSKSSSITVVSLLKLTFDNLFLLFSFFDFSVSE